MHHIAFSKNLIRGFVKLFLCGKTKKPLGLKYFYLDVMMMTPFAQCAGAQHLVHQAESEL